MIEFLLKTTDRRMERIKKIRNSANIGKCVSELLQEAIVLTFKSLKTKLLLNSGLNNTKIVYTTTLHSWLDFAE